MQSKMSSSVPSKECTINVDSLLFVWHYNILLCHNSAHTVPVLFCYCRLRSYRLLTPAGAYVPGSAPGTADLTFKMKKVDPEVQVQGLDMPHEVGRSVVPDNIQVSVQQR